MRRETVQLFFNEAALTDATLAALRACAQTFAGLRQQRLARNLEGSWGAGTYTWDLWWDEAASAVDIKAALSGLAGFERVDQLSYAPIDSGVRAADLQAGIWRTLLLRVRPEASAAQVRRLEQDLLRMPQYMAGIRNWSLSRVTSNSTWTHVWQQEYAQLGDLLGEYLLHPFHWGWVDRLFDPEFPEWTVETTLCHAFCPLEISLLSRA